MHKHCQNRNYHYIQCNQNGILLVRSTHISPRKSTPLRNLRKHWCLTWWYGLKPVILTLPKSIRLPPSHTLDIIIATFCWQKWCIVSCPGDPLRRNPIPNVQCRFGFHIFLTTCLLFRLRDFMSVIILYSKQHSH